MKNRFTFFKALLLLIICGFDCFSQSPQDKMWDHRFGGTSDERLTSLHQTSDMGYILGGYSFSGVSGNKTQPSWGQNDYWIVKTDLLGNLEWNKRFGGSADDFLYTVQQTTDKGYILGGYSGSGISGDKTQSSWGGSYDYWIVKTDATGNYLWDKRFGGSEGDLLRFLQQTGDGGYILGGYSYSGVSGDKTQPSWGEEDYWIVKSDSLGNYEWDARFGGSDEDILMSVHQTSDKGYILGGYSVSGISGDKTQSSWGWGGSYDYWIVKTDSLGNYEWDARFGGTQDDFCFSLEQTADKGYVLGGYSNSGIGGDKTQFNWAGSSDYWIVKTDSLGIKEWDRRYGGNDNDLDVGNITQTQDGGYMLAGTSYSDISGDKTEDNLGIEQTWVIKTDYLGNLLWDKTVFTTEHEEIGYAIETVDGCFVMANYTDGGIGGYKSQASWSNSNDYWFVKFCDTVCTSGSPNSSLISDQTSVCEKSCINFFDLSDNCPSSWHWIFEGGLPQDHIGPNPPDICYNVPGTYDVTLITGNIHGLDTLLLPDYITVYAAPAAPVITQVGNILTSSPANAYQWFKNASLIAGATNQQLSITQSADYSVTITDSNGCSASSTVYAFVAPIAGFESPNTNVCGFGCTNFYDLSLNNPTTWFWSFQGGTPASSTNQNPTDICFMTPGSYDVELIVSNPMSSDTLLLGNYITVYAVPLAPTITQNGNLLTSSPSDAYQWFKNGSLISGATNQQLLITQAADYTVTITDSNGCSASTTVYASLLPSAGFETPNTSICHYNCISYFDLSINDPTSWLWNFQGGTPSSSTDQNPMGICYLTPGTYDVELIATNSVGSDTLLLTDYLIVKPLPQPVITQIADTLMCTSAVSYQWFQNSVLILGATNQFLVITQPGNYSVMVTDSSGCSALTMLTVILQYPQSDFSSNGISGCTGTCFDFTNTSLNATSYQWYFPGGNPASSSLLNPSNICYASSGQFDVTLITFSAFGSDTLTMNGYITIFPSPIVTVAQNGSLLSCSPAANSYQWFWNGYPIPNSNSQTITITQTGTYSVEAVDSNSCIATDTLVVTLIPANNFASSATAVCEKFCVDFLDASTNNPVSWTWEFPGGSPASSSDQNPAGICYNNPGTFDVTLITTNQYGVDTLTLSNYITVYPTPPLPTINQTGNVLTSSAADFYQWQLNAVDLPGATNQSYTISESGFYTVVVTDSNGCLAATTLYVDVTGMATLESDLNLSIYPNPSNGRFIIEWKNKLAPSSFTGGQEILIEIRNPIGQLIVTYEMVSSAILNKEIDLIGLAQGCYVLELHCNNSFIRKRIVVL